MSSVYDLLGKTAPLTDEERRREFFKFLSENHFVGLIEKVKITRTYNSGDTDLLNVYEQYANLTTSQFENKHLNQAFLNFNKTLSRFYTFLENNFLTDTIHTEDSIFVFSADLKGSKSTAHKALTEKLATICKDTLGEYRSLAKLLASGKQPKTSKKSGVEYMAGKFTFDGKPYKIQKRSGAKRKLYDILWKEYATTKSAKNRFIGIDPIALAVQVYDLETRQEGEKMRGKLKDLIKNSNKNLRDRDIPVVISNTKDNIFIIHG